MKVFVVFFSYPPDVNEVWGVFSTEALALKYLDSMHPENKKGCSVEEFKIDGEVSS